ncbi:hypothetical protein FRC00_001155 [Tulasnella sp. 408]|nr:hypothetical protein FRC00_001155 [Tulasnella sp. 408]
MFLRLFRKSDRSVEVIHTPAPPTLSRESQQQLVSEFASLSATLFYLEFADGGNTQIQISVGDDAPDDLPIFIGVHGMAVNTGDVEEAYLHEILYHLVKNNRGRGVVFNLRGCGESTATSPAFHHGGSTSDLGGVVTWATMRWPKSKVYVIGTSLGAVIAAKTLEEWGEDCPVSAAALVSPVYDFKASCEAIEANFVPRTVFNPAVGTFYAKLVKKNKDAFDVDHWTHTRPKPFSPATPESPLTLPFLAPLDTDLTPKSLPLAQESRTGSFASSLISTWPKSVFSTLPSPSTPNTSVPPTPFSGANSFCISPAQDSPSTAVVLEHTPEIKCALAKSLKDVTSRIIPQSLTKFWKSFVAATAHFQSGEEFMAATSAVNDLPTSGSPSFVVSTAHSLSREEFMAETSAVKDLPDIRVPCLAVNCADDSLMPRSDLPRSEARKSPYFVMTVPKNGDHLGTFTTKKWRKKNGNKRYHTAIVEEWFKANMALPQLRPRPRIINAHQGFLYPESHSEMAFHAPTGSTPPKEDGSSHT